MTAPFPKLFSEVELGPVVLRNRIVSTGHHTYLSDRQPDERLVAYHEARARGGAGLIVSEIVAVHETAGFSKDLLAAESADCIPAYARLVDACHRHGTKIFAQLFHPGREILSAREGMAPVAWAPSAVPNERFHIMPKAMPVGLIEEIVRGYGTSAAHLAEAGFDGFEIVGSHGYLPAQFLNPRVNLREDEYGGSAEKRLRFLQEVIASIRSAAPGRALGLRLSGSEMDDAGLSEPEILAACAALAPRLDYLSVVAGTSASLGGSVHIVPPMGLPHGYTAPLAGAVRAASERPVIVTGRINQPQIAEQILASGQADLCGMTRAMICDPEMARKAQQGALDEIRACIGCNQACIGRAHKGLGISCIQHPETGRELTHGTIRRTARPKRVAVVGGGPAGLKAAAVAASRGHEVTLFERSPHLGGQAKLAQLLPGREEFGGIIANLAEEARQAGAEIRVGTDCTPKTLEAHGADEIVLATGARPYLSSLENFENRAPISAWDVLENKVNPGKTVVVADWKADWIGLGLAERLAANGSSVTLCTNAALAGENLQIYTRNHYVGRLHRLGVEIRTHARLFGADEEAVFFQDTLTGTAIVLEGVDTLVLSLGHVPDDSLERALARSDLPFRSIGDCVVARTAEEAVYEGLIAGSEI